jgi:hypothetical protein
MFTGQYNNGDNTDTTLQNLMAMVEQSTDALVGFSPADVRITGVNFGELAI